MATIKSYTDLEQSKKLVEILPLESADMAYYFMKDSGKLVNPSPFVLDGTEVREDGMFTYLDCWSLAALLGILPVTATLLKDGNISNTGDVKYNCECSMVNIHSWFDNPVDACMAMIEKLHELKML